MLADFRFWHKANVPVILTSCSAPRSGVILFSSKALGCPLQPEPFLRYNFHRS